MTRLARLMGLRGPAPCAAVVVTGAGSAFCSGGDIGWIGGRAERVGVRPARRGCCPSTGAGCRSGTWRCPRSRRSTVRPSGRARASRWPATCGYAATSARFSVPFTRLGMHPGMAATWLLPEVAGTAVARDLLLTGRSVDAYGMLALGLVSSVLPDEGFLAAVLRGRRRGRRVRAGGDPADQGGPRAAAATPPSTRRCSGRRSPSRSRWRPRTCRRGWPRPARSGHPGSPAADARMRRGPQVALPDRPPSPCGRFG